MIDIVGERDQIPQGTAAVFVKVTNKNSRTITDRFDGVPVIFAPNKPVTITAAQANHFFGWPGTADERAIYMAKRHGWNTAEYVKPDPNGGPDALSPFRVLANNVLFEVEEYEWTKKGKEQLADDGIAVETMPTMESMAAARRSAPPDDHMGTKVGVRKGSPVLLGGAGGNRRPGRPSKRKPEPADPGTIG